MKREWSESKSVKRTEVSEDDIASVISMMTKIPVQKLGEQESEKLLRMEEELTRWIVGQQEAVAAISRAIRRNRAGLLHGAGRSLNGDVQRVRSDRGAGGPDVRDRSACGAAALVGARAGGAVERQPRSGWGDGRLCGTAGPVDGLGLGRPRDRTGG